MNNNNTEKIPNSAEKEWYAYMKIYFSIGAVLAILGLLATGIAILIF